MRTVWRLLGVLSCGVVVGLGLLWWQQERLIYVPGSMALEHCPTARVFSVVSTPEGVRMLVFGTSTRIAVLYHGNAGTVCDRTDYVGTLLSRGYQVLLVEYPGYGSSDGRPSHQRTLAAMASVQAYVQTLRPTSLVVLGESIGSGPAVLHAVGAAADHLILVTPFTTLSDIVRASSIWWLAWLVQDPFYNQRDIANFAGSLLILGAERDEVIPVDHSQAVHDAALRARQRRLVITSGATHNTVFQQPGMWQEIADWLR
jgi:uncharacterized protein